jgi:hypothetical protein
MLSLLAAKASEDGCGAKDEVEALTHALGSASLSAYVLKCRQYLPPDEIARSGVTVTQLLCFRYHTKMY